MLWSLILKLPHPGDPLHKAFLVVEEQTWGDGGVALLSCAIHEEVPMLAKYVEPTLYNIYGDAVLDFFAPDGYDNALDAEWDENERRVIPEDE